jgi:hypothetical protein
MTDTTRSVTRLRPGRTAAYDDTAAMEDIHALLTSDIAPRGSEALACIAEILARTGRSLTPAGHISADVAVDGEGLPVGHIDVGGTHVYVGQDPGSPGIWVRIQTSADAGKADPGTVISDEPPARPSGESARRDLDDRR